MLVHQSRLLKAALLTLVAACSVGVLLVFATGRIQHYLSYPFQSHVAVETGYEAVELPRRVRVCHQPGGPGESLNIDRVSGEDILAVSQFAAEEKNRYAGYFAFTIPLRPSAFVTRDGKKYLKPDTLDFLRRLGEDKDLLQTPEADAYLHRLNTWTNRNHWVAVRYWDLARKVAASFTADKEVPSKRSFRIGDLFERAALRPDEVVRQCWADSGRWPARRQRCEVRRQMMFFTEAKGAARVCFVVDVPAWEDRRADRLSLSLAFSVNTSVFRNNGPRQSFKYYLYASDDEEDVAWWTSDPRASLGAVYGEDTEHKKLSLISAKRVDKLGAPYSEPGSPQCVSEPQYTPRRCEQQCRTRVWLRLFGCREAFMSSSATDLGDYPACTLGHYYDADWNQFDRVFRERHAEAREALKDIQGNTVIEPPTLDFLLSTARSEPPFGYAYVALLDYLFAQCDRDDASCRRPSCSGASRVFSWRTALGDSKAGDLTDTDPWRARGSVTFEVTPDSSEERVWETPAYSWLRLLVDLGALAAAAAILTALACVAVHVAIRCVARDDFEVRDAGAGYRKAVMPDWVLQPVGGDAANGSRA